MLRNLWPSAASRLITSRCTGGCSASLRYSIKIAGRWRYLYRAIDQHGQVIDVLASERRDQIAARRFFHRALAHGRRPVEAPPTRHPSTRGSSGELLPEACHIDAARQNNRIESDHSTLKARLRPMSGLKRLRSAQTISTGHALAQNIRRSHYELATDTDPQPRLATAFAELARTI
ncbi:MULTISPECIES: transposase [unclassified Pseudofrankia]|uniref:transposase n=1 Tax=unclassified Pseudofrankia TaxID=2994372 RepID=UPI001F52A7B0|nr:MULTISPECIES: transposase [unclassified Pseudofrankia]MDT3444895.1 DDE-type integrase/transposase/recombinase [Pseudofrankia sp. BMG5.37]